MKAMDEFNPFTVTSIAVTSINLNSIQWNSINEAAMKPIKRDTVKIFAISIHSFRINFINCWNWIERGPLAHWLTPFVYTQFMVNSLIPLGPSVRLQLISFINYINSIHSLFHTSLLSTHPLRPSFNQQPRYFHSLPSCHSLCHWLRTYCG